MIWRGVVEDGQGNCSKVRPFPTGWFQGSLNLRAVDAELHGVVRNWRPEEWAWVEWMPTLFPVRLPEFGVDAIMGLDPLTRVHEVVAKVKLRDVYGLRNGDVVTVDVNDDLLLAHGNKMG